jgi:putative toxin-antitoxin system antitoxin component (TIGR02293 family)
MFRKRHMEKSMVAGVGDAVMHRGRHSSPAEGRVARGDPRTFWVVQVKRQNVSVKDWRRAFHDLVGRVMASPGVTLFDAVEAGVPTYMVNVIAGATGEAVADVMDIIGVSQTTFRRKEEANEPLPDVAGHRVMGFLRVAATLRRLLEESGDPELLKDFDLEAWVAQWMREQLPELGSKTPAEMLRNPEGQRAVEQVLERMRGGLPA